MRVYLDHAATSPLRPEAREAMLPWLDSGNASTLYAEGRTAKLAIDVAREKVSGAIGAEFAETIFTSGGTESATLALAGTALAHKSGPRKRILISATEHHCVLHSRELLEALGYVVETIPVDRYARPILDRIDDRVLLVATMHANNELGSITDVKAIADRTHETGALVFCDAVQSFGKIPVDVTELGIDLLSVSAHKIGGPKGVGALYVRAGTKIKPIMAGGGQERELRAGTENAAAIVGFGAAIKPPYADPDKRNYLRKELIAIGALPTVPENMKTLPTHLHVRFPGISAETLLIILDRLGVSAGSGAACSSGSIEPSHVLLACGYSMEEAKEGLRFSLGPETTLDEVAFAAGQISKAVEQIRSKHV
ncbi:MAG TPA: cysteine desulfurase family protein [Fimbriimonas sp.]|nr:cysteine desulfurase family protein [Fimbriimonas sp.]